MSVYSSGGTVVTVSGTMEMGCGDGGLAEAIVAEGDGAAAGVAEAAARLGAAIGAERLAAQPSRPRNLIDGLLANLTAVGNMVAQV